MHTDLYISRQHANLLYFGVFQTHPCISLMRFYSRPKAVCLVMFLFFFPSSSLYLIVVFNKPLNFFSSYFFFHSHIYFILIYIGVRCILWNFKISFNSSIPIFFSDFFFLTSFNLAKVHESSFPRREWWRIKYIRWLQRIPGVGQNQRRDPLPE